MSNFILYNQLPAEDFLSAYGLYKKLGDRAYIPPGELLRDFKFQGEIQDKNISYPIEIFFLLQYDLMADATSPYVLFRTETRAERELEKFVKRFRNDIRSQKFKNLCRIDPKYGLIVGASRDSIDPNMRTDRDHCFITLYLTEDLSHPEISLLDYVDRDHKEKYKKLFQALNHGLPKKKGIMGFDLKKLSSGGMKGEQNSPFTYEHVQYFIRALTERYQIRNLVVSLIFKEMSENDLQRSTFDHSKGLFYPTGDCHFFNSTEELLG